MTTDEPTTPARNPFEPPERRKTKPLPGDFGEGVLGRASRAIYWYIVLTLLLALASVPTLVIALLLAPSPSNVPFIALAFIPLGPALSAALYTVRARYTDEDLAPSKAFWKGYRLNWADVLRLWVPALVVIGIIGFVLAFADTAGIGTLYRIVLGIIGALVAAWALQGVAIATFFSFRTRDVARLAVYYLLMVRVVLGVIALVLIAATVTWFLSELVLALIGGIWVWFWYQNDKPMLLDVFHRFTKQED
ncbi:MAG: DUF624 domain-containing protein [Promicromonosporaceae bacterium]|nr:DUF624 domain-containing protein [Promicromonosporaceae bacterium]